DTAPLASRAEERGRSGFAGEEVVEGLARSYDVCRSSIDEDLGGKRAGIVVGSHDEAIGAGAHQGDRFAGLKVGQLAVLAEEVAAFADRTDDIDLHPLLAGFA